MHGMHDRRFDGTDDLGRVRGIDQLAVMDGDFIMSAAEVQPVLKALRKGSIHVVALHTHMIGETADAVLHALLGERRRGRSRAWPAQRARRPGCGCKNMMRVGLLWRGDPHQAPPPSRTIGCAVCSKRFATRGRSDSGRGTPTTSSIRVRDTPAGLDGVLVWVDPITDGHDRSRLDPMLARRCGAWRVGQCASRHDPEDRDEGRAVSDARHELGYRYAPVHDVRGVPRRAAEGARRRTPARTQTVSRQWRQRRLEDRGGARTYIR